MRKILLFVIIIATSFKNFAQPMPPVFKGAITANREKLYKHTVNNTINKNLSTFLSDSTEDRWEDAFYALELIHQKTPWVNQKIQYAVDDMQNRSSSFQRALLELLFANYSHVYTRQVHALFEKTTDPKIFAMSGEYLLLNAKTDNEKNILLSHARKNAGTNMPGPLLEQLIFNIQNSGKSIHTPSIHTLLKKDYLNGNVLMISFQRKDRNYPGLVMVRDANGQFLKDSSGYFSVPQLARSVNNMPGYITNGNTPEGIFRMDGFGVSKGSMIGPTINVQLTMPFEYRSSHFYRDSTLLDTMGNMTLYKKLLPENFHDHFPMYQSFYAGNTGRSEIIAHGTTVDPIFYASQPFYPLIPTMGCLCTKEFWSNENGERLESDQQLLYNALTAAGGPHGYAIVINIDDNLGPVSIYDIIPYLKLAAQK